MNNQSSSISSRTSSDVGTHQQVVHDVQVAFAIYVVKMQKAVSNVSTLVLFFLSPSCAIDRVVHASSVLILGQIIHCMIGLTLLASFLSCEKSCASDAQQI